MSSPSKSSLGAPVSGVPRIRTVLVDDLSQVRQAIEILLRRSGRFEVVGHAEDGSSGVTLVSKLKPDLVIMDIQMPVKNGIEATRTIKQQPGAPCIVIVSSAGARSAREALAAGADGFCDKQNVFSDLLPRILALFPPPAGAGPGRPERAT